MQRTPRSVAPVRGPAAAYYATTFGWSVFPLHSIGAAGSSAGACTCSRPDCGSPAKHPRVPGGFKSATRDLDQIARWWTEWPDANVGLATGTLSGFDALDIDVAKLGEQTLAELEAAHGALPVTVVSNTGGGGRHALFVHAEGLGISRERVGAGLDVRADGGYIVAPPSIHASGRSYAWDALTRPGEVEIAPWPAWLLDLARSPVAVAHAPAPQAAAGYVALGDRVKRASAYLARMPAGVSGENGHGATWKAACALLHGFELPAGVVLELLVAEFNTRCTPPWSTRELEHKVATAAADARQYGTGYLLTAPRAGVRSSNSAAQPAPAQPSPAPDAAASDDPAAPPAPPGPPALPPLPLKRSKNGRVINGYANLCIIVRGVYAHRLTMNEMTSAPHLDGTPMRDTDMSRMREEIDLTFELSPASEVLREAVYHVADERRFHPVRSYIESVAWDGVVRLPHVAQRILGINEPSALTVRMLRCWFLSAVARAFRPGCKVDCVLVLKGAQGLLKSSFFAALAGEWFSDSRMDISNKDALMQLASSWIYEWGEIENVTTSRDAAEVKAFCSSSADTYRPPFMRSTVQHPRSSVIVGSTNRDQFLNDPSGSRRFWIVEVYAKADLVLLREWRDQLWAEALVALENEAFHLTDAEELDRELAADTYVVEDALTGTVSSWLRSSAANSLIATAGHVTTGDILALALKLEPSKWEPRIQVRIGYVMAKLMPAMKWSKTRPRVNGVRTWAYSPQSAWTNDTSEGSKA